jgi:hypothetical protein
VSFTSIPQQWLYSCALLFELHSALRPLVDRNIYSRFPSALQKRLLDKSSLPDILFSILTHHRNSYRVIVTVLECLFCLVSPARPCVDPASYHIITTQTGHPAEVTREFSMDIPFDTSDERCADLLHDWWPYVIKAIHNARWRRRKHFCIFLVCCCDMSCVHKDSVLSYGEEFPPLSLMYSSICLLVTDTNAVRKVFFSKQLCAHIMSFM